MNNCSYFFLGANSCSGFYSLFDKFTAEDTVENIYIIKGGPGCGKSSFMRSIAAALRDEGMETEYIECSGDPDSLDGLYIPGLKTAYLDGTSPHVLEPKYAGIREVYINMGIFYNSAGLVPHLNEIIKYTELYKSYYKKAYNCLSAAEKFQKGIYDTLFTDHTYSTIARRIEGIIFRELKKTGRSRGKVKYRFLSALSGNGYTCNYDTAAALCEKLYAVDNDYSLAPLLIEPICEAALKMGYDVTMCPSPLDPSIVEHILIPELSLGFISVKKDHQLKERVYKHIRLDSLIDKEELRKNRRHYRAQTELRDALLDNAYKNLKMANLMHNELEAIYNPSVDFGGVYALAEAHAKALLNKRRP